MPRVGLVLALLLGCAPGLEQLRAVPPTRAAAPAATTWSPDVVAHFLAAQVEAQGEDAGSLDRALAELRRALNLAPREPAVWRAVAALHARAGNTESAIEHARRAWELDPEDPQNAYLLGEQLLRIDEGAEAEPLLLAAAQNPDRLEQPALAWYHLYLARRQLGRADAALAALDGWRTALPEDPAPLPLRASLLWHEGRAIEAADAAMEALRRSPQVQDEEPRRILKEALALEPHAAAERLEEVVRSDWSALRIHDDLADLWAEVGRWDHVLEHTRTAAILGGEADPALAQVPALLALHRAEEARVLLEATLPSLPAQRQDDARIALAEAWEAMGQWRKAVAELDLVPPEGARCLEARWRKAALLAEHSTPALAMAAVEESLALGPDVLPRSAAGILELGVTLARRGGDAGKARAWLSGLERSAPERALPYRALVEHDQGLPGATDRLVAEANRLASLDAGWLSLVASTLRELGEGPRGTAILGDALPRLDLWVQARPPADALQGHRLSVDVERRRTDLELAYCDQLVAEQRIDEATLVLRRVIARRPHHAVALNYLGFLLADHGGDLVEARTLVERALTFRPYDPAFRDSLGYILLRQGDATAALPILEEAWRHSHGDPEIAEHLGEALLALGQVTRAKEVLRAALAAARPDDPRHRVVVSRVRARLGG